MIFRLLWKFLWKAEQIQLAIPVSKVESEAVNFAEGL
jgi:hypothetical protein